jgi:hypothetical protein
MGRLRKAKVEEEGVPAQRTRFETNPNTLSSIWASIRRHLTAPTHPSTTSESAHGSGIYADTDLFTYNDAHGMRSPSGNHLPLELIDPVAASRRKRGFRNFLKSGNSIKNDGISPDNWRRGKGSGQPGGSRCGEDEEGPFEPVATVVVENDFEQVIPLAARSDSGSTNRTPGTHGPTTKEGSSLFGKSEDKEGKEKEGEYENNQEQGGGGSTKGDRRSEAVGPIFLSLTHLSPQQEKHHPVPPHQYRDPTGRQLTYRRNGNTGSKPPGYTNLYSLQYGQVSSTSSIQNTRTQQKNEHSSRRSVNVILARETDEKGQQEQMTNE